MDSVSQAVTACHKYRKSAREAGLCGWVRGLMGEPQIWGALMSLFGAQLCVCLWRLKSIRNLLGVRAPLRPRWLCASERPKWPTSTSFSPQSGAARQSGSTGQMPGEPWSIKTCCPTIPRESNTVWPAWKRSLGEGWLCSGGSVWCINGFVEYYVWSLFFFLIFQLNFVLGVSLSCGVFKLTTIQQEVVVLAVPTILEAEVL